MLLFFRPSIAMMIMMVKMTTVTSSNISASVWRNEFQKFNELQTNVLKMEAPATTKTVTLKDVLAMIDVAPSSILLKIKDRVDKQLTSKQDVDNQRDVMRALAQNASGAFDDAPMPSDGWNAEEAPFENPTRKAFLGQGDESLDLDVTCSYVDNYGVAFVSVQGEEANTRLREMQIAAQDKGWYFPFGFGANKNCLKIKKFKIEKGGKARITATFKTWSLDGKNGYSCYAKRQK